MSNQDNTEKSTELKQAIRAQMEFSKPIAIGYSDKHIEAYRDKNIDGEPCDSYPNFNGWIKALENDPEYIKKVEKQLDKELGKDRIF